MQYWTCPYCGSNLDFGEKCDCNKKESNFYKTIDCDRGALHGDDKLKLKKEKDNGYERIFPF